LYDVAQPNVLVVCCLVCGRAVPWRRITLSLGRRGQFPSAQKAYTGMRRITTLRSTTDRIYDGGPIRLWYNILEYYIVIVTIVLQLPTIFSTVTGCTGL